VAAPFTWIGTSVCSSLELLGAGQFLGHACYPENFLGVGLVIAGLMAAFLVCAAAVRL